LGHNDFMSKKIYFTEMDAKYRQELGVHLVAQGAVPTVLEVPDDFDINEFEGVAWLEASSVRETLAKHGLDNPNGVSFAEEFADAVAWLNAYKGNSDFYHSLKSQLARKGTLSPKQIECVRRAMQAEGISFKPATSAAPQNFSMASGTVLVLSKFISTKIAQAAKHERAHRAVEVVSVLAETDKAYYAKVKLTAKPTSHCGICGLTLENAASIAAGIGPICADKYGIPHGEGALAVLDSKLSKLEVECWVPKRSIKERSDQPKPAKQEAAKAELCDFCEAPWTEEHQCHGTAGDAKEQARYNQYE
jgi:hypothetical protein